MHFPQAGSMVSVRDLAALNQELRKATEAGYQTPAGLGSGSMSALVPQSLEGTLATKTFTMAEIALWPSIPKVSVSQTVHEFSRIQEHGYELDGWISEGGAGVVDVAQYTRDSVKVRYLSTQREVTDVATLVGVIGPSANALAEETERGTIHLLGRLEHHLFHSRNDMNSDAFDGLFKQIEDGASGNVTDMRGKSIEPNKLQEILGEQYSAPNYGQSDCIYAEPRVLTDLIRQTVVYGRHDQLAVSAGSGMTFGVRNLTMMAPYGPVPVKAAPFLHTSKAAAATGYGSGKPLNPVIASSASAGSGSQFAAADVGDYIWQIVAVGDQGYSAPIATSAVTTVAGEEVSITITDNGIATSGAASVKYYRVYRSDKDGAVGTCRHAFDFVRNPAADTVIKDTNADLPGTSKMLMIKHDQSILEFVRLLDFLRRPLAETKTSKPFLLMLFGSPLVKVPSKCWMLKNVGVESA